MKKILFFIYLFKKFEKITMAPMKKCKNSLNCYNFRCVQDRVVIFSPPENDSFRKDLCFTRDVFFFQREISEIRGPTGAKFCTMVSTRRYFIIPVQNFGGRTPKNFQGPKTCKIWLDFGRLGSRQRISPKRMKIFKIGFLLYLSRFLLR